MLVVLLVYAADWRTTSSPRRSRARRSSLSAFIIIIAVTLFGATARRAGRAHPRCLLAGDECRIFVQELTKERRNRVAAAKLALEPPGAAISP